MQLSHSENVAFKKLQKKTNIICGIVSTKLGASRTVGIPQVLDLKYGSEEKGSSLYKCSILLGFILSKNLRGL